MAAVSLGDEAGAACLLAAVRGLQGSRLDCGTAGNLSVRGADGFWVTPSARPYRLCEREDLVWVDWAGLPAGRHPPSSEWRLHRDLYRADPAFGAIVHAHSPFATALACHGEDIPAFHYMIARFGGPDVRCAPYAVFGSEALSRACVAGIAGRSAVLLAQHGMVVAGRDPEHALAQAFEFEALCEQYWRACQLGPPKRLDAAQMAEVQARFAWYGSGRAEPAP